MNTKTLLDDVSAADPLNLDSFFMQRQSVMQQDPNVVIGILTEIVIRDSANIDFRKPYTALAALRDLDFLLCASHRAKPFSYRGVPGLEELLHKLGRAAGHIPRGSNLTYTLGNPVNKRMRLFTGLPEERLFIEELVVGLRRLEEILNALSVIAHHNIDCHYAVEAARALEPAWEPMIGAAVAMLRNMPPEIFSHKIVTCFLPLKIGQLEYQGVTGAQNLNIGVDYLLWGVGSTDDLYAPYAEKNISEQLRPHQLIIAQTLESTGGVSILTYVERQLATRGRTERALEVVSCIEALLRRIGTFRAAHRRLADLNLPLRATPTGSGGHTTELLDRLATLTVLARRRARMLHDQGQQ